MRCWQANGGVRRRRNLVGSSINLAVLRVWYVGDGVRSRSNDTEWPLSAAELGSFLLDRDICVYGEPGGVHAARGRVHSDSE